MDDLSTGRKENIASFLANPNFIFTKTDILIFPDLQKVVCWAHRIYHFAAVVGVFRVIKNQERVLPVNAAATERLLRAARLSTLDPRILLASTSEVYGGGASNDFKEDTNLVLGVGKKNCTIYVVSKIALEFLGFSFYQQSGLKITSLRIFNTIGPRQIGGYGMVVPRFIAAACSDRPIEVYGNGQQTRSFCDVRDLIVMIDGIANNLNTVGEVLNVGNDEEISINGLAELIKALTHSHSVIKHLSYSDAYGEGFEDFMIRKPSLAKLRRFITLHHAWDLKSTLIDLIKNRVVT